MLSPRFTGILTVAILGVGFYLIYIVDTLNGIKDDCALQQSVFAHMQSDILVLKRENAVLKEVNARLIDTENEKEIVEAKKNRLNRIFFELTHPPQTG